MKSKHRHLTMTKKLEKPSLGHVLPSYGRVSGYYAICPGQEAVLFPTRKRASEWLKDMGLDVVAC